MDAIAYGGNPVGEVSAAKAPKQLPHAPGTSNYVPDREIERRLRSYDSHADIVRDIKNIRGSRDGMSEEERKLRRVSEEFASFFIGQLFTSMRQTVKKSELMDGGFAEDIFQSMADTEMARETARGSGYGLTELIYQSLAPRARVQPVGALEGAFAGMRAGVVAESGKTGDAPESTAPDDESPGETVTEEAP